MLYECHGYRGRTIRHTRGTISSHEGWTRRPSSHSRRKPVSSSSLRAKRESAQLEREPSRTNPGIDRKGTRYGGYHLTSARRLRPPSRTPGTHHLITTNSHNPTAWPMVLRLLIHSRRQGPLHRRLPLPRLSLLLSITGEPPASYTHQPCVCVRVLTDTCKLPPGIVGDLSRWRQPRKWNIPPRPKFDA